jgi:hypothetical protein
MPNGARVAEGDPRLAPIDLALPPGRRREPDERPLGRQPQGAQGSDEELDRLVTASIAALAELLKQDLRRIVDLLRPLPQILGVGGQQRVRPRRPVIPLPGPVAKAAADGLAIQVQAPRDLGDRQPRGDPQAANFLPSLLADHRHLLAESDLCADGRGRRLHLHRHFDSLLVRRVGKFQLPQVGNFALPLTPVRVIRAIQGGAAFVQYDVIIPKELSRVIVLDASFPIRELCKLPGSTVQPLPDFDGRVKSYHKVDVRHMLHSSGRGPVEASFSEERAADRLISREVVHLIANVIPDGEQVLVFCHRQQSKKGLDIPGILKADLETAGLDVAPLPEGESADEETNEGQTEGGIPTDVGRHHQVYIETFGRETGLNDYAHCKPWRMPHDGLRPSGADDGLAHSLGCEAAGLAQARVNVGEWESAFVARRAQDTRAKEAAEAYKACLRSYLTQSGEVPTASLVKWNRDAGQLNAPRRIQKQGQKLALKDFPQWELGERSIVPAKTKKETSSNG